MNSKWVAMWGNAVSINENKPEGYAKNITLRYPAYCPFDGDTIRITFDNYCGTEAVNITRATVLQGEKIIPITFDNADNGVIPAGDTIVSDEIKVNIKSGDTIFVSIYLGDYTQMRSSVYVQGPLSGGKYAIGDMCNERELDIETSRRTNNYYFLSNISIKTAEENHTLVCYGDSITAQDWPDFLQLGLRKAGINNLSVIRRATSGSRILRQYSCITYESYGLMGKMRFEHEVPTDGADMVIIQQGINDIIHPVGVDINPFRPMSDLPTAEELFDGLDWYVKMAKEYGYKVFLGSLLPIKGWRTYADFRDELRCQFNGYMEELSKKDPEIDFIDFAMAVADLDDLKALAQPFDSGDHLHPSTSGYDRMAEEALKVINRSIKSFQ